MNLAVAPLTISKQMEKIAVGYVPCFIQQLHVLAVMEVLVRVVNAMMISFAATGRFCFGRNDVTAYFL